MFGLDGAGSEVVLGADGAEEGGGCYGGEVQVAFYHLADVVACICSCLNGGLWREGREFKWRRTVDLNAICFFAWKVDI